MLEWFAPLIIAIWSFVLLIICLSDNMPNGLYRYKGRIVLYSVVTLFALFLCFFNAVIDYQYSQDRINSLILENQELAEDLSAADNVISLLIDSAEISFSADANSSSNSSTKPDKSDSTTSFVASSTTKLLHRSDCNHAPPISSSYFYETIRDALLNGYDLCPYCFS